MSEKMCLPLLTVEKMEAQRLPTFFSVRKLGHGGTGF